MEREPIKASETADELFNNKTYFLLKAAGGSLVGIGFSVMAAAGVTENQEMLISGALTSQTGIGFMAAAVIREIAVDLYNSRKKRINLNVVNEPKSHDTPQDDGWLINLL